MAGRARTHALRDELTKRSAEYFDPDEGEPVPTILDYVCERVAAGTTTKALAQEISESMDFQVDYSMLIRHLSAIFGAEATDSALDSARARASHVFVEDALEIVDEPQYDAPGVSRAASRARQRTWMAERYNRKQYGSDKGVSVTVTVGLLHLQALQAVPARVAATIIESTEQPRITAGHDIEDAQVVE